MHGCGEGLLVPEREACNMVQRDPEKVFWQDDSFLDMVVFVVFISAFEPSGTVGSL